MEALNIFIDNPCQEDWNNMHPTTQGKFCNSCAKQVVDFTSMSDAEVLHFFKINSSKSLCGRMAADQVIRPLHTQPLQKNKKWYWPVAAFLFLLVGKSSAAQTTMGDIAVIEQPVKKPLSVKANNSIKKAISIKALSAQGTGIEAAVIHLSSSLKTYTTGKDGTIALLVDADMRALTITHPNYITKEILINNKIHYVLYMNSYSVKPKCPPVIMGKIMVQKNY